MLDFDLAGLNRTMGARLVDSKLRGTGELDVDGARSPCSYQLNLTSTDPFNGDGWLRDGPVLLEKAYKVGHARLTLDDGRALFLVVLGFAEGTARVVVEATDQGVPADQGGKVVSR